MNKIAYLAKPAEKRKVTEPQGLPQTFELDYITFSSTTAAVLNKSKKLDFFES
jgi:hypothetical protein